MKFKLLYIALILLVNTVFATNGELFFNLYSGTYYYHFHVEKIPGEYYYDENFNVAYPPDYHFTRIGSQIIKADFIFDNNYNGTYDDNGNQFLMYYGLWKVIKMGQA